MAAKRTGFSFNPSAPRPSTASPSNGRRYEEAACRWLCRQGYRILNRNFRSVGVELDCLARDREGRLWVVEIRGRRNANWRPIETLSGAKMARLERATEFLCLYTGESVHLALLEVVGDPQCANALKYRWVALDG